VRPAALVVLVACGGAAAGDDAIDGGPPDGAVAPDAGPCGALVGDPAWLDGALADWIGWLASLDDRSSPGRRDQARDYLIDALAGFGVAGEERTYGTGANVVARLPGADPSAGWVLLGAHFDSVPDSPGANDNASGTAAVLAAARLLRETCRSRGVIVAFFDQEEIGLLGSTYLAEELVGDAEDLREVHTIDQVGWDDDGDRVFEIELPTDAILARYQAAADALGLTVSETDTAGTDHSAFRAEGFAAAGVTEEYVGGDTTPHYHLPSDTFETIDLAYTADAVRLISRAVADATE
jgi:hypothetical protein